MPSRYPPKAEWIGRFFGIGSKAEMGIIGFVSGVLVMVVPFLAIFDRDQLLPYLTAAGPILTGILGYLFGRRA